MVCSICFFQCRSASQRNAQESPDRRPQSITMIPNHAKACRCQNVMEIASPLNKFSRHYVVNEVYLDSFEPSCCLPMHSDGKNKWLIPTAGLESHRSLPLEVVANARRYLVRIDDTKVSLIGLKLKYG